MLLKGDLCLDTRLDISHGKILSNYYCMGTLCNQVNWKSCIDEEHMKGCQIKLLIVVFMPNQFRIQVVEVDTEHELALHM